MASESLSNAKSKLGHVFHHLGTGLKTGARIGAIVGVGLGVFTLLASTSILTMGASNIIMGVVGYALGGALSTGITGALLGGTWGAIKGIVTPSRPDGEAIMREAENCRLENAQQQGAAPEVPQQAVAQQTEIPPAAMQDVQQMTQQLNQLQAAGAASAAPQQAGNWQQRVQQQSPNAAQVQR